jgi:hypothetical protein
MSEDLFSSARWLVGNPRRRRFENNIAYGRQLIPHPRDEKITRLLKDWMDLDALGRTKSRSYISEQQQNTLRAYCERMASRAVRDRNEELILLGLIALGMDNWGTGDPRENILLLPLHYDASLRIGVSPASIFEKAASLLNGEPADAYRAFLRRPERDRSLQAMGYIAGNEADGFRYIRTW